MKTLSSEQINAVSGGTTAGDIAMGAAGSWASTVAGAAVGSIVPGVGTVVGAAVGFGLGTLIAVGYALTQSK